MKKPVITSVQLMMMAVGSALVFPYTFMPILTAPPANQDVWAVLLSAVVYILLINAPLLFMMNRYRGMTFNEMTEATLGKPMGKITAIPFVAFFLYCYIACALITAQFIAIYLLPGIPLWALLVLMIIPVTYSAYKGAGTIGRLAVFIVPFVIFTIVVFFFMGISKMELNVLQPVLADSTFLQINQGAFLTGARYSEILIFLVFSYYLGQSTSITKTYFSGLAVFVVNFLLILVPTILVLGLDLAEHAWNPYYVYTRQVEAFGFLERVQALNTLAWFPAALLKLTMYLYMGSSVLSGIFNAKSYKSFVIPLSIVVFIVCMLPIMNKSSTVLMLRSDQVFPWIIIPIIFIIPLLMVIMYLFRKKKINALIENKRTDSANNQ